MKKFSLIIAVMAVIFVGVVNAEPVKYSKLQKKKWTLTQSPNFSIVSDASAKQVIKIAQQLERFRAFSSLIMGINVEKRETPTQLTITKSRGTWKALGLHKDYVSYTRTRADGDTIIFSDMDGFRGNSLLNSNPGRATVFNALAYELFTDIDLRDRVPLWYYRGFASYLAGYTEQKEEFRIGEIGAMGTRLSSLFNSGGQFKTIDVVSVMSKKSFVDSVTKKEMTLKQRQLFSVHAYLLVHYFYGDFDRRKKLANYINLGNNRTGENSLSVEQRIQQAFDQTPRELAKAVKKYGYESMRVPAYDRKGVLDSITLPKPEDYTQRKIAAAEFWQLVYPRLVNVSNNVISYDEKKALYQKVKQYLPARESVLTD